MNGHMMIELECKCGAHITFDIAEEEGSAAWMMAHRFANAHADSCQFMTPNPSESKSVSSRDPEVKVVKARRKNKDETP